MTAPVEQASRPATETGLLAPGRAYRSTLHDPRLAAVLGIALGLTFTTCFVTGVLSHLIQNPTSWFTWPSRPAGLYRFTQGLHVASGIASIPLLGVKLWAVAPRFWAFPPVRSVAHGLERAMLLPLVGGGAFLLVTGLLNTYQWYPWEFSFIRAHYALAYVAIGGLIGHVGAKFAVTRAALAGAASEQAELPARSTDADRRAFLGGTAAAVGAVTLATVGQTVGPLHALSVLAPRDPTVGPQGVPVNRTAAAARITDDLVGPAYRLIVRGDVERELSLSLAELRALPQHGATLPIACVEGWSASAPWRGVRLRDLLSRAGAAPGATVEVRSLQSGGSYRSSEVLPNVVADRDTLLALDLRGEPLHPDHGYPVRLIAPNRPGVMQTKWIHEVWVR